MKIAFAGKGGAWKTTLASLLIQKLAQKYSVLALDLDSNVNLAQALGFSGKMPYFGEQKDEIMSYTHSTRMHEWEERVYMPQETDGFYDLHHPCIEQYSLQKENIHVMSLGTIPQERHGIESMCDRYEMAKVFLNHIRLWDGEILVADLAAGIEMISRATVMSFDIVFVVTDSNHKNLKVTEQILQYAENIFFTPEEIAIVPNKYIPEGLEQIHARFPQYTILPWIPFCEEIYADDSQKKLSLHSHEQIAASIDALSAYIEVFPQKSQAEIYARIGKLDEKKKVFLQ